MLASVLFIAAGSILWCTPFVIGFARTKRRPFFADRSARWGVALECIAYSILWQGHFWQIAPDWRRFALSIALFALACLLSWTGARALGQHLRVDAAVGPDHTLVKSGPYRIVRHPIYTSMLCILLGTGLLLTHLPLLLLSLGVFLVGTDIRMRKEERLLQSIFGDQFTRYRRTVPRLIPFLK
jgi:protein-S-isoprenylcysteine O-methyltransferase Ste14